MPKGVGVQVPPRAEGETRRAAVLRLFDRFRALKIDVPVLMPRKPTIGKTSKISVFQRKIGWICKLVRPARNETKPFVRDPQRGRSFSETRARGTRAKPPLWIRSDRCASRIWLRTRTRLHRVIFVRNLRCQVVPFVFCKNMIPAKSEMQNCVSLRQDQTKRNSAV
jgi:hypothetical protein